MRFQADPQLHEARGRCGGPFPLGPDGRPLVDGGEVDEFGMVTVPGDVVIFDPKFKHARHTSCPRALAGCTGCPEPKVPGWLQTAFEAASWVSNGGTLRDLVDEPTDAFRGLVLAARIEGEAAHRKAAEDKRPPSPPPKPKGRRR